MAADTGTTNWPLDTDDINLPSDETIAPTSAGDGHYTLKQWRQRATGMLRAIAHDLLTAMTHALNMGGFKITNLGDGTATTDAATWGQVQALINGLDWGHPSVRAATAAALPAYTRVGSVLTGNANGALAAVDGVTLVANDRLLLKNGAAGADNGIYVVTQVGAGGSPFILTRAADADSSAEMNPGLAVIVEEGTANADTVWFLSTNAPITLNTTALTFTEMPSALSLLAGFGMTRTGQTLDVVVPVTAGADLAADVTGSATSFTTIHSISFTPKGTVAIVNASWVAQSDAANLITRVLVGATGYPAGLAATAQLVHFARTLRVTGLTPGSPVTIAIQFKVASGSYYCRPLAAGDQEFASISAIDAAA